MVRKTRYFNYLVINNNDFVYILKRTEKDIWQDLYEFPLIETTDLVETLDLPAHLSNLRFVKKSKPYQQLLTHQKVIGTFWEFKTAEILRGGDFLKIERKNLNSFAFPKIIDIYLKEKVLTLF